MFNNLLNKGKCALGFHKGDWRYEAADNCTLLQVCELCGKESRKVEHTWGEWLYPRPDDCTLERTCQRCHQTEQTVEHQWGEAVYIADGSCEMAEICSRCQAQNPIGVQHQWDEDSWVYVSADKCEQAQSCKRCGTVGETTRLQHIWGEPVASEFYSTDVFTCTHCGDLRFNLHETTMGTLHEGMSSVLPALQSNNSQSSLAILREKRLIVQNPALPYYLRFVRATYPHEVTTVEGLLLRGSQIGFDAALVEKYAPTPIHIPNPLEAARHIPTPQISHKEKDSPAPQAPVPQVERALVGHWRHTDSMSGGGISFATDTHMILEGNGTVRRHVHSNGSTGERRSGEERGSWSADSGRLTLKFGRKTETYIYQLSGGDTLFFPQESHYRLWDKV